MFIKKKNVASKNTSNSKNIYTNNEIVTYVIALFIF